MTGGVEAVPAAAAPDWRTAPAWPASAAPLRAVDSWHCSREGDRLLVTARVAIRADDPGLGGHFPGFPIYPGIYVIETLGQAMALAGAGPMSVLGSARFLRPLLGGDELTLRIVATPAVGGGWLATAEGVRRDGATAARLRADFRAGPAG